MIRTDHGPLIYAAQQRSLRQGVSEAAATAQCYPAVSGHVPARSRKGQHSRRRAVPCVHHRHAYAADCRRPQRSDEGLSRAATPPGSSAAGLSATGHRGQHVILQHRQQHHQAIRFSRPAANGIRRGARSLSPQQEIDVEAPGTEILLAWLPEGRSALGARLRIVPKIQGPPAQPSGAGRLRHARQLLRPHSRGHRQDAAGTRQAILPHGD